MVYTRRSKHSNSKWTTLSDKNKAEHSHAIELESLSSKTDGRKKIIDRINQVYGTDFTLTHFKNKDDALKSFTKYIDELEKYKAIDWNSSESIQDMLAKHHNQTQWLEASDQTNHWAFLAGSLISLTIVMLKLSTLRLDHGAVQSTISIVSGESGNYIDALCGFVTAYALLKEGKDKLAGIVLATSIADLAITTVSVVQLITTGAVSASLTGALGFAVPIVMCVSALIEQSAINDLKKSNQEIKKLLQDPEITIEKRNTLRTKLLINKAKILDHTKNRNIWLGCATVMFAVATLSMLATPFGGPAILLACVLAVSVIGGLARLIGVGKNKNQERITQLSGQTLSKWFELTSEKQSGKNQYLQEFIEHNQNKIEDLMSQDPELATKLIEALDRISSGEYDLEKDGLLKSDDHELLSKHLNFKEQALKLSQSANTASIQN